MLTYCIQFKYTKDALMAIIDQQQDRKAAAAALCESVGGNLVGMWGAMGQEDYHQFAVIEVPNDVAYMAAYMKLMKSGAFENLRTIKCYTTAQVAEAASNVAGIDYTPATG